jgi:hypothetical protein
MQPQRDRSRWLVRKAAANTKGGLHFTIGSAAGHDSPGALDLREDLALAKATLLYADHVKLCSVGSSVLSGIAEYAEAPTEKRASNREVLTCPAAFIHARQAPLLRGGGRLEGQGGEAAG